MLDVCTRIHKIAKAIKQPRLIAIGGTGLLRGLRWRHVWLLLKAIIITVVIGWPVMKCGRKYLSNCSTTRTVEFVHDLCAMYDRGEVAGNMCYKLCRENQFTFQGCANNNIGKTVAMMQCRDCERLQVKRRQRHSDERRQSQGDRSATVVLKSKLHFMHDNWTTDHYVHFGPEETTLSMVYRTTNAVISGLSNMVKFKIDLANQSDVLAYIWRQRFKVDVTGDGDRNYAKASLQSILSLVTQEEYSILANFESKNASYVPGLYGTCGPAYLVEYTPSLTSLGYVLYNGKQFSAFASMVSKTVPWVNRVKVALQLLHIIEHLESLEPPVFLCDIQPHNFGVNGDGDVKVLDVDSFHSGQVWPPGRLCNTDRECRETRCFVNCNLTTHTCQQQPVSTNLQNICRYIFSDPRPLLPVGLLRMPPSSIATELRQLLKKCATPDNPGPLPWKSDATMHLKLTSLLQSTLS